MPGATTSSFFASSPLVGTNYPAQNDSNTEPVTGNTAAPSSFYQDGGGNYAQSNPDEVQTFLTEAQAAEAAAAASAASASASANTATSQATSASTNAGVAYTNAQSAQSSASAAASSAASASSSASTATTEANTATTGANTATTQATNAASSASAASTSASNAASSASAASTSATNAANSASAAASSASSITGIEGQPNGIATLDSGGHLSAAQIPLSLVGALQYQGVWNASTNSPALTSGTGTKGQYYKVSVAGSTTVDGNSTWNVGDSIIFDGTTWDKIDGISSEVVSVAGRTGVVTLAVGDVSGAAPLASPALTGTPTAPTATVGDNSTKIATTAFVLANGTNLGSTTPLMDGTAAVGTASAAAHADHVHPTDTSRAPLASPALTGTPTAPTAALGTNSTQLATTAFVLANGGSNVVLPGYLYALTLSTAGSSSTFSVAAGAAVDNTAVLMMKLSSSISKTTSAWAVGTGTGALDTGTIAASTWYHVHLISNGTTVDVLVSLSATSPTMPSGYSYARRIGSMKTNASSQWTLFHQFGDVFLWDVPVNDYNTNTTLTTTAANYVISAPTGVNVQAKVRFNATNSGGGTQFTIYSPVGSAQTTLAPNFWNLANAATNQYNGIELDVLTDTSAHVSIVSASVSGNTFFLETLGWRDTRGTGVTSGMSAPVGPQCKAAVYWTYSGGTITINSSYNVTSITHGSAGNYTVNFTTPFGDTHYFINALADSGSAVNGWPQADASVAKTTSSAAVQFVSVSSGSLVGIDPPGAYAMFFE